MTEREEMCFFLGVNFATKVTREYDEDIAEILLELGSRIGAKDLFLLKKYNQILEIQEELSNNFPDLWVKHS